MRISAALLAGLLFLPGGADESTRIDRLTEDLGGKVVCFSVLPQPAQLFIKDNPIPATGEPGTFVLTKDLLDARSDLDQVAFRFHKDGYRDQTVRLSWKEVQGLTLRPDHAYPNEIRLWPASPLAYAQQYPVPATVLGLACGAGLALLMGRAWRARTHELRNRVFERYSVGADTTDPFIMSKLGPYRLVSRLGAGGMAVVYKGVPDDSLDESQAVAVKMIKAEESSEEFRTRFRREIQVSSQLNHPNVMRVLDYGEHEGLLYLVMDYVDGLPLKDTLPAAGMSQAQALTVLPPLFMALSYAHSLGIVHRDLKPENIMRTRSGQLKLMDFGLARNTQVRTVTTLGSALGTPAYMAPEQIMGLPGRENLTGASDQYSLGVVLYELLTGRRPFEGDTPRLLVSHLQDEPLPISSFRPDLPPALDACLLRMLAKEPEERYRSVAEAGDVCLEILRGQPFGEGRPSERQGQPDHEPTENLGVADYLPSKR